MDVNSINNNNISTLNSSASLQLEKSSSNNKVNNTPKDALNLIREPFLLKDFEYVTSTSIGIYVLDNALESLEDIIKKSDIALYEAKERGRNTYYIFTE